MTKSLIHVLCVLALLAAVFGFWLSFEERAPYCLTPSAILVAGSLIAAAIVYAADTRNK